MNWDFLLGALVGAGVVLTITRCVKVAVDKERAKADRLREENSRLRTERDTLINTRECENAYRQGKRKGREEPYPQAERFARTFENRRVQFADLGERRTA